MSFLIVLFWLTGELLTNCDLSAIKSHRFTGLNQVKFEFDRMKILLLAFGLIAGMATEKNMTYAGSYKCYDCRGSTYPGDSQKCFDESKLSQENQCSGGKLFMAHKLWGLSDRPLTHQP